MIIDSSAKGLRCQMTGLLVDFEMHPEQGELVALDVCEMIGTRLAARDDYQMGVMGLFVRTVLLALDRGRMAFPEAVDRLCRAAMAAPLGHAALADCFDLRIRGA